MRTLKDQIEDKTKGHIEGGEAVMEWLVRWAAMMYTRFNIGADGKSAYERMKGRRCKLEVVPFGESVWYKELKTSKENQKKV